MKSLALLLILFQLSKHFSYVVPSRLAVCSHKCKCTSNTSMTCSSDLEVILFNGTGWDKVIITCYNPQANMPIILTGLKIELSHLENRKVEIVGCPLPNTSFYDLLTDIGVSFTADLHISSFNGTLQSKHFDNLQSLRTLTVGYSNLGVLPVDLFRGLTNLNRLILQNNTFLLTKNIFQYTPNIVAIHLFKNQVSEVSFDIRNGLNKRPDISNASGPNPDKILYQSKEFVNRPLNALDSKSDALRNRPDFFERTFKASNMKPSRLNTTVKTTKKYQLKLNNNTAPTLVLHQGVFAELNFLGSVIVYENNLKLIHEDTFSRSVNIQVIALRNNCIRTLKENTFLDLKMLATINLSHNQISHLPGLLFSTTKFLSSLDLSHNLIRIIEPKLFLNLTLLDHLNLSYNKIKSISGEQFSQLESVTTIDLSHNQLVSLALDPLLSDLDYSVLYNCKSLEELKLQKNYLTEIYEDWRLQLTKLRNIRLSNNMFTKIRIADFASVKKNVYLANNRISVIEFLPGYHETLQPPRLHSTDLSNNLLNCCDHGTLIFLINESNNFKKKKSWIDNDKCKKPEVFNNTYIHEFSAPFNYRKCKNVPAEKEEMFQDRCPKRCRCVYRHFTRSSVIKCQNADLLHLPRTLPLHPKANHTELNIYNNKLVEFHLLDDPVYRNITYLNLSNNSIRLLDIRGISLRLKKLDLRFNNLSTLSAETLELLENALELERLELQSNPWSCDVSNVRLAQLIINKNNLIRFKGILCADNSPMEKIVELYLIQVEYTRRQFMTYVVSGVVVILMMKVFILTVLYYQYRQKVHVYCYSSRWKVLRWLVSHPDIDDNDKLYDAFIIYSQEDELFVVNHLVPYLEETEDRKYKLCLHFRDWIPGEQIMTQIGRSVRSSCRAIVVLSPNFLHSVWGVAEFRVAHAEALKDGTARVIVILYEDVSDDQVDEELKAYLQTNTYVRWGSPWFWKQLTYALPHPQDREHGALHYFSRG